MFRGSYKEAAGEYIKKAGATISRRHPALAETDLAPLFNESGEPVLMRGEATLTLPYAVAARLAWLIAQQGREPLFFFKPSDVYLVITGSGQPTLLLAMRSEANKTNPGKLLHSAGGFPSVLPGGIVEPAEACARRELQEELGLHIPDYPFYALSTAAPHPDQHYRLPGGLEGLVPTRVANFACVIESGIEQVLSQIRYGQEVSGLVEMTQPDFNEINKGAAQMCRLHGRGGTRPFQVRRDMLLNAGGDYNIRQIQSVFDGVSVPAEPSRKLAQGGRDLSNLRCIP